MQVKIIIGTIAFMLTMVLLGFYTLLEPARMEAFTDGNIARKTEAGAYLYKNNCLGCHGIDGQGTNDDTSCGTEIVNGVETPIACVGRPLNFRGLLCDSGDTVGVSARMDSTSWNGSKYNFVKHAIAGGRAGGVMPAWSQDFGGPLQENEIENLTLFVLNYQDEDLCAGEEFVYPWPDTFSALPDVTQEDIDAVTTDAMTVPDGLVAATAGDAVVGAELYASKCASCHNLPEANEKGSGPTHNGFAATAASRIGEATEDGAFTYEDAADYAYRSVIYPSEYIVDGYTAGAMPSFGNLPPQDIADITAYLLDQ